MDCHSHGMEKHHGHLQVKRISSTCSMGEYVAGSYTDTNATQTIMQMQMVSDDSCEYAAQDVWMNQHVTYADPR